MSMTTRVKVGDRTVLRAIEDVDVKNLDCVFNEDPFWKFPQSNPEPSSSCGGTCRQIVQVIVRTAILTVITICVLAL
jgi:hypothetical protein